MLFYIYGHDHLYYSYESTKELNVLCKLLH